MNFNYFINQFIISIMIILSIAFYTLLERKILSYQQNRMGPNKVYILGLLQPITDAIKLINKKELKLTNSNNMLYWSPPFYSFFMLILMLNLIPTKNGNIEMKMSMLIFLCIVALTGFSTIVMGWSSNSKYTMIGSIRSLAQSISYEVMLFLIIFILILFVSTFSFELLQKEKLLIWFLMWMMTLMLMISLVCEVNRAPFDLSEGESELVSGFNTEYGMTKFSLIFLTEYGMMIFMSLVVTLFANNITNFGLFMKMVIVMIIFIWLRSSYPRIRYDLLMYFTWKNMLFFLLLMSTSFLIIL